MAPGLTSSGREDLDWQTYTRQDETSFNKSTTGEGDTVEPIAVVGLSLKFPAEATSAESFWELLMQKRCVSTTFAEDRISLEGVYHSDATRRDTIALQGGHFLREDSRAFDAPFFSISPAEAASMDPQQRLLLEVTYRALENAGIPMGQVSGSRTSVFAGCFTDDYKTLYQKDLDDAASYAATGITTTLNANRISWFFNTLGTSVNVDTACSSSLVALDLACQSLRSGDSSMSIACGANLILATDLFHILSDMNMLSPDSRCWSFDERGNGYARGEGIGVLIIKRLSDAIRDGDTIRAIIRSTASNQDGFTPGITQPNQKSQELLIRECYARAGLDMRRTCFFEAHGTGTAVGDPIEANALGAAFREGRDVANPLYVGAVKSNIGHLEGASGIAGVIKAILALEKGIIPPNTNLDIVNPRIDEEFLKIKFPRSPIPWPKSGLRRASINSFGFGGSNAHAILDDTFHFLLEHGLNGNHFTVQYPPIFPLSKEGTAISYTTKICTKNEYLLPGSKAHRSAPKLLVFSAADEEGVSRIVKIYTDHLSRLNLTQADANEYLDRLCYTLASRRSLLAWKAFAILESPAKLQDIGTAISKPVRLSAPPKLAFIFTGQGAQWAEMGKELLNYSVFEHSLQEAETYFQTLGCSWKLLDELLKPAAMSRIGRPLFSQAICTAIQVALVDLLGVFGINPAAVIGHSSGEIGAAYCIGALSRESSWRVAYMRGLYASKLLESDCFQGSMMSVGLPSRQIHDFLDELPPSPNPVVVACYNSPNNVTVSGDEKQIDVLKRNLDNVGAFARKLKVGVAYHSPQMDAVAEAYAESIKNIKSGGVKPSLTAMISTVTGQRISADDLRQPSYWVKNMVSPVRFSEAVEHICAQNVRKKLDGSHLSNLQIDVCLEVGPHSALRAPIRDITTSRERPMIYLSALNRPISALTSMLDTAGQLHCLGYPVNIRNINHNGVTKTKLVSLCDLPEYPFDHSKTYFHESRISKSLRLRKQPKLDLLGKTAADWNPLEAQWRNFIRVSELPWVEDHKINGIVLYPAAGMLVMAIEAIKQLAGPDQQIAGYELRDVNLHTALTIPTTATGVEVQFFIHQAQNSSSKEVSWSDFRLCAYVGEQWTEICHGSLRIDYGTTFSEVGGKKEEHERLRYCQQNHAAIRKRCTQEVDSNKLYHFLRTCGFDFGPAFQSIRNASCTGTEVTANVKLFQWDPASVTNPRQRHVVHPCTLDGLLQLPMAAYTRGGTRKTATLVPSLIRKMWISNSGLDWPGCDSISATSQIVAEDTRGVEVQISALNHAGFELCAQLEGVRLTFVAESPLLEEATPERHTIWNLDWKPDIELLNYEQSQVFCAAHSGQLDKNLEPIDFYRNLSFLLYAFLARMVKNLACENVLRMPSHLEQYMSWAHGQLQKYHDGELLHQEPSWETLAFNNAHFDTLCEVVEHANVQGKVYVTVGRNLVEILRSEVNVLELLFHSDLMENLYQELSDINNSFKLLDQFLCAYAHKYPDLRYLEVGAGTGGSTTNIINTLLDHKDPLSATAAYSEYWFTDISEAFFERAKEKFQDYPNMIYKRLDIEQPPDIQGFGPTLYNVIFAANVVHATKELAITLKHLHRLLTPGGKLILYEITNPEILRNGFTMGLLPGWWLSTEEFRQNGPCLSEKSWNSVLKQNGFSGVDVTFRDYESDGCHELSILITTKLDEAAAFPCPLNATIVSELSSVRQREFTSGLAKHLQASGAPQTHILSLSDIACIERQPGSLVVFTEELCRPLLRSLDEVCFCHLQQALMRSDNVIWLTRTVGDGLASPDLAMVDGLARVIRTENDALKFVTIGLDSQVEISSAQIEGIANIAKKTLRASASEYESAFEERNGVFHICRLRNAQETSKSLHARSLPKLSQGLAWAQSPALKMIIGSPGLLDTLHFVEDLSYMEPLAADEVEIEVRAIGLNFKDCLIALGRVAGQTLGNECAGIVTRVGTESALTLDPGDRVCMSTVEAFKTYARSKKECVCKLPPEVSFTEAAALPTQFVTAWTCIYEIGRLEKGESILIHAGAGGTGQAGIQIAQYIGAEVFVTVGSDTKKQLLIKEYGLPEDHIFYSRDTTFALGIQRMTNARGVDVVLNSLAGDSLLASWECLAPYGRFVEIGKKDILANSSLPMLQFNRGVTFAAFDGSIWMTERPRQAEKGIKTIIDKYSKGVFHTARPLHTYNISDVAKAFRLLADGKSSGKAVLEITTDAIIPTILNQKPSYYFQHDRTYVIAGGLGGIGRSIALWLAGRGARNLILLSRSGACTSAASGLVRDLEADGVCVATPRCDISDEVAVRLTLAECAKRMPPIDGCIQASMVLQDVLFENMSFSQWEAAIKPKVNGSWNLHKLLPGGMSFFILLSSVSGICGQRGQANYAAGNTYLDALARFRVARGENAVAINLGAMVSDGYIAENKKVMDRLLSHGSMLPINRDDLYALLDYYCNPVLDTLSPLDSQIVIGINTPQNMRAQGHDEPAWLQQPLFRAMHRLPGITSAGTASVNNGRNFQNEFTNATSLTQAGVVVSEALIAKLARSLSSVIPEDVDRHKPMHSYGVDSLLAVEVRTWIAREFQANIPIFEILGSTSFATIGITVASKSLMKRAEWAT